MNFRIWYFDISNLQVGKVLWHCYNSNYYFIRTCNSASLNQEIWENCFKTPSERRRASLRRYNINNTFITLKKPFRSKRRIKDTIRVLCLILNFWWNFMNLHSLKVIRRLPKKKNFQIQPCQSFTRNGSKFCIHFKRNFLVQI